MEHMIDWFREQSATLQALMGTTFTWGLTALGAAFVFFFKNLSRKWLDLMLGFTGGVMIAASFWSLLNPAIELSEKSFSPGMAWVPAAVGFIGGAAFIYLIDKILPHLHLNAPIAESEGIKTGWNRTILLVLAITLHNIPEGLAVGVSFGAVGMGHPDFSFGSAMALAIGIGIQNFPEGIAVAVPLRRMGLSRWQSFWWGQSSALVEPVAGVIGAIAVAYAQPILPYALAFAAGAMIYVVVEEVIPETQQDKFTDLATMGLILGFVVMMALDVGLG
ncbi:MAG: ZIP family metal transporter [Bacteroidetes bacterium]|nr:MAG: ZIP family metal transporter [Bacteroidota bacterium]